VRRAPPGDPLTDEVRTASAAREWVRRALRPEILESNQADPSNSSGRVAEVRLSGESDTWTVPTPTHFEAALSKASPRGFPGA
jgi:hypothetical protein